MKSSALFLFATGLFSLVPLSAIAKVERTIEKTFPVSLGGRLKVETQGGDIRIETSADAVVTVVAKQQIRASSEAEADELLRKLEFRIEKDSEGVTATAIYQKSPGFHRGSWPPVSVDFIVTVPQHYQVELKTSGGDLVVADLEGKVSGRTSGGDIVLGRISGEINVTTSGGDIRLAEGRAPVKLHTSGGDIRVVRVAGPAELGTSGGDISVKAAEGMINASTSGGDLSAVLVGPIRENSKLSTSGGSVRVTVDKGAAFLLDASTSGGEVDLHGLPITIEKGGAGKSRLSGQVNGSGPVLTLRTSGGEIDITGK